MSPLAPQMNGIQTFNHSTDPQRSLIDPRLSNNDQKFVYSLGELYDMRHSQSRVPNLGNRDLLSSLSRSDAVPGSGYPNLFSFNLMSSALGQIHGGIRRSQPQSTFRQNQFRHNGGHMNNGDRQRQPNRGKI